MTETKEKPPAELTTPFSQFTRDKASRTRIAIESFYAQAVTQCMEREVRAKRLEEKMAAEGTLVLCVLHPFIFKESMRRKKMSVEKCTGTRKQTI